MEKDKSYPIKITDISEEGVVIAEYNGKLLFDLKKDGYFSAELDNGFVEGRICEDDLDGQMVIKRELETPVECCGSGLEIGWLKRVEGEKNGKSGVYEGVLTKANTIVRVVIEGLLG